MIPNTLHFIYGFKDNELKFYEFINVMLSSRILKPDKIIFHTATSIEGKWFSLLKNSIDNLIIKSVDKNIDSNRMDNMIYYAHKADYYRLYILNKEGGIYFDIDVFPYKSFDNLLNNNKTVLGIQKNKGLCNAVILSPQYDTFLNIWLSTYTSFKNNEWDRHSVVVPFELSKRYPGMITVLSDKAFFYPLWHNNLSEILDENNSFIEEGYCCHLWKTVCIQTLLEITPQFILDSNSFYSITIKKHFTKDEIISWQKD